jgi:hypothetical protein
LVDHQKGWYRTAQILEKQLVKREHCREMISHPICAAAYFPEVVFAAFGLRSENQRQVVQVEVDSVVGAFKAQELCVVSSVS